MKKLTKTKIDLAIPKNRDFVLWDGELKGFGARIWPTGKVTFVFKYRTETKRQRKVTIGTYGPLTLDQAKRIAQKLYLEVSTGRDPQGEKESNQNSITVAQLCERYLEDYALPHKKPSSTRSDRGAIKNHILPNLGKMPVKDVTNPDIYKF